MFLFQAVADIEYFFFFLRKVLIKNKINILIKLITCESHILIKGIIYIFFIYFPPMKNCYLRFDSVFHET